MRFLTTAIFGATIALTAGAASADTLCQLVVEEPTGDYSFELFRQVDTWENAKLWLEPDYVEGDGPAEISRYGGQSFFPRAISGDGAGISVGLHSGGLTLEYGREELSWLGVSIDGALAEAGARVRISIDGWWLGNWSLDEGQDNLIDISDAQWAWFWGKPALNRGGELAVAIKSPTGKTTEVRFEIPSRIAREAAFTRSFGLADRIEPAQLVSTAVPRMVEDRVTVTNCEFSLAMTMVRGESLDGFRPYPEPFHPGLFIGATTTSEVFERLATQVF